jgi:hypothetical protein
MPNESYNIFSKTNFHTHFVSFKRKMGESDSKFLIENIHETFHA